MMLWSILLHLIILTVFDLQLIAATYVRKYISQNLFSVIFAIISAQKKLDHVNLAIRKS